MGSSRGPRWSRDRVYGALLDSGLQPTRDADDFMAQCPVHADRTPSLHVWEKVFEDHADESPVTQKDGRYPVVLDLWVDQDHLRPVMPRPAGSPPQP